ncbi:hypothetical protein NRIC_35720 [Enterococcus florum]|uniref:Uncharacterized protein n=1 Tax=Enterococcus florum TaxID=2480627 RepID=A0A4P5PGY0_9ENTE|nr:hypothetical protein NRIC_35720 [Enterococcus florum]
MDQDSRIHRVDEFHPSNRSKTGRRDPLTKVLHQLAEADTQTQEEAIRRQDKDSPKPDPSDP